MLGTFRPRLPSGARLPPHTPLRPRLPSAPDYAASACHSDLIGGAGGAGRRERGRGGGPIPPYKLAIPVKMYSSYGTGSSLSTPSFANVMPFEKHFYIEHPRIKVCVL
jgi:hypothetical protein